MGIATFQSHAEAVRSFLFPISKSHYQTAPYAFGVCQDTLLLSDLQPFISVRHY